MMKIQKLENGFLGIETGTTTIKEPDSVLKKLSLIKGASDAWIQGFSTRRVLNEIHIGFAAYQTNVAIWRKRCFSPVPALDFLIRLSGQKQVTHAIRDFGIKEGARQPTGIVAFALDKTDCRRMINEGIVALDLKPEKRHVPSKEQLEEIRQYFYITRFASERFPPSAKTRFTESTILEKIALLELEH